MCTESVFGAILNEKFQRENFESAIKGMTDKVVRLSLSLLDRVQSALRPVPRRNHYQFNLGDVGRVIHGLLSCTKTMVDGQDSLLKLWAHESMREFSDRLVTASERLQFVHILDAVLSEHFDSSTKHLFHELPPNQQPLFTSFLSPKQGYSDCADYKALGHRVAAALSECRSAESEHSLSEVVLFQRAVHDICHLHRIMTSEYKGHALLLGAVGTGRRTLTKLAAHIANYEVHEMAAAALWSKDAFYEAVKALYVRCGGKEGAKMVVVMELKEGTPSFVVDAVDQMLATGQLGDHRLSELFTEPEVAALLDSLRTLWKEGRSEVVGGGGSGGEGEREWLYRWFMERVRGNLHFVLLQSPRGVDGGPAVTASMVKAVRIKWFGEWSESALKEVAAEKVRDHQLVDRLAATHGIVVAMARRQGMSRCVGGSHYLSLCRHFVALMDRKKRERVCFLA